MSDKKYLDYEGLAKVVKCIESKIDAVLSGLDAIPSGVVLMWSGAADATPDGWAICDGQNGTPDLRGRFVLGANEEHLVGEKGGEDSHTLTVEELPAHTHEIAGVTITDNDAGGSLFSGGESEISPSESAESGSTGEGVAFSIMPPYYVLAYIMKVDSSKEAG